ncbi:hypothetical protein BDZ89DRAFT_1125865 [Hymenopellis radicata]|nr:hypothetical protein BDZ89DRAFT_1125865 [Hymenopellis radicata]
MFQYSPQSSSVHSEPNMLDFDMNLFAATHNSEGFDFAVRPPSPVNHFPLLAGQTSIQESHVMYFFEHVRKTNFRLTGNTLTNVTYSLIVQDPRGAVTNAVCALSSLHFTRMRVAQGLEPPDSNPEHSTAQYFHDEAFFQLASGKQTKGCHDESDVLAALYLICYSQMSGQTADWQPLLTIAIDWIAQTGLTTDENPKLTLLNMSASRQLVVKLTMWIEIFSSFTAARPAKYMQLYKRLLGDEATFWDRMQGSSSDMELSGLHMESLTGCPDEVMLCFAEVSHLAQWKMMEQRKGSLSYRELIRRADEIEQRLKSRKSQAMSREDIPLHPNLLHTTTGDSNPLASPSEEVMRLVGNIFRETAILYLHTTVNDMQPAVPEIGAGVKNVVQLLQQLAPSEIDRVLIFPICLSGCMTDDSTQRDVLKARLQAQDESIGNLLRTRLLMEAVWQKRDIRGGAIDWRETLRERCPHLLLI